MQAKIPRSTSIYRKSYLARGVLLAPAVLLYATFALLPQAQTLYFSLLQWDGIGESTFIGLKNFGTLLQDGVFLNSIGNTARFFLMNLLIHVGLGLLVAYLLSLQLKGWQLFRFLFFLPAVISGVAIAFIWFFIYNPRVGLILSVLKLFGLSELNPSWLGDVRLARWAITLPSTLQWFGFSVLIYLAGMQHAVPDSVIESAVIDGASRMTVFWRIVVPMIRDVIAMNMVFLTKGVLAHFDTVYMLTKGDPHDMTHVMGTLAWERIFTQSIFGYGSSIIVVIFLGTLLITGLSQKFIRTRSDSIPG
ncbi:MAG: sugar ABC transporter permease [Spirochaetaceae bacterium]|nr:sugar ABC transporter permease [Spirochaetaceae bacterium]